MERVSPIPRTFRWRLRGWPPEGPNVFNWEDGLLRYIDPQKASDTELSLSLTNEDWHAIWGFCDEVGIWSWPRRWQGPFMADGLTYCIEIHDDDGRYVFSEGQTVGMPVMRRTVMKFHHALQSLVRGHDRRDDPLSLRRGRSPVTMVSCRNPELDE